MKRKLFTTDVNLWMYWCSQFDHHPSISKVYVTAKGNILYEFDKEAARALMSSDPN
jgi:hypothetical protein